MPIPESYLLTSCEALHECQEMELNLYQIIDLSLTNSQKTLESFATTKLRAAEYGKSFAPLYPNLSAETYYEAVKNGSAFANNFAFPDQYRDYGTYISMSWLLFDCGATCANIETFRQMMFSSNWSHNRTIQSVLDKTLNDYYDFVAASERLRAAEANLNDASTVLSAATLKHTLGIADIVDELQAETEVAKRELDLLDAKATAIDDKTELVKDLGIPANTVVTFKEPERGPDLERAFPPLNCLVQEGYQFRPDLYAAFSEVLANASNVTYQNRNQWFKGNLSGTGGCITFNIPGTKSTLSPVYDAVVALSVPIFAGYEYLNKIREAKAALCRSKAQMRELELTMIAEITRAYENLNIARDKVRVNINYVSYAEEAYKASLDRYKAGVIDYQALINALTNLADARYSLAESKRDWYVSLTDLSYATGTLVK